MLGILKICTVMLLLLVPGCGSGSGGFTSISMEEAAKRMAQESGYVLLDVRTEAEFKDGHIPGAINIPNETIGGEPISLLPNKEAKIYVYCRSGNRSKQAAKKLTEQGYADVVEIGGIGSWKGPLAK